MKKITLFVLMSLNVMWGQTTIFDFDTVNPDQVFLESWNGTWPNTAFAKVANPNSSGINTSANVGKYTANGGADAQISSDNVGEATLPGFDFDTNHYFSMKVWVNKPLVVSVEFRNNGYYPTFTTKTTSVTTINQWVTIEFDCSDLYFGGPYGYGTYNIIGVSFDKDLAGGTVANDVYYFDDIKLTPSSITLSNNEFIANSEVEFYPNPAVDFITVKEGVQKVTVIDINGSIVKEVSNVAGSVDVSSLAKGVYVIKLQEGNTTKTGKLIKK